MDDKKNGIFWTLVQRLAQIITILNAANMLINDRYEPLFMLLYLFIVDF